MANEKFELHCRWLKAINKDKTLRDINMKARDVAGGGIDIVHVAKVIGEGGANGHSSYVGTGALTEIFGCSDRTIERLVKQLVALKWIVITATNGGEFKRGKVYTINIPSATPEPTVPAEPKPEPEPYRELTIEDILPKPRPPELFGECAKCSQRHDPWAAECPVKVQADAP